VDEDFIVRYNKINNAILEKLEEIAGIKNLITKHDELSELGKDMPFGCVSP
jgi:hypothetical protein